MPSCLLQLLYVYRVMAVPELRHTAVIECISPPPGATLDAQNSPHLLNSLIVCDGFSEMVYHYVAQLQIALVSVCGVGLLDDVPLLQLLRHLRVVPRIRHRRGVSADAGGRHQS